VIQQAKGIPLCNLSRGTSLNSAQKKLEQIQALGHDPYPRNFAGRIRRPHWSKNTGLRAGRNWRPTSVKCELLDAWSPYRLWARWVSPISRARARKSRFALKRRVGEQGFQLYHLLDWAIPCVRGHLFRTKTNELTAGSRRFSFFRKRCCRCPKKWHGADGRRAAATATVSRPDPNEKSRQVFETRARIVRELRKFFDARGYIEVETPMMHPIAGGAAARPFKTHHKPWTSICTAHSPRTLSKEVNGRGVRPRLRNQPQFPE